jgi:hypothetical protein
MESAGTIEALSPSRLNEIAINRIISEAARLSRDKDLNVWRDVYEPARQALAELGLTPAEYQHAIAELTEAMKV